MNPTYQFCQNYFQFCKEYAIRSALARPQYKETFFDGTDLDILIHKKDISVILNWIRAQNFLITSICKRNDGVTAYLFLATDNGIINFHIDFIYQIAFKGISYLTMDEVFHRTINLNGMIFPEPVDQAMILLVTHGIKHRSMDKQRKYAEFIQYVAKQYPDELLQRISVVTGMRNALQIEEELKKSGISETITKISALRYMIQSWPVVGVNVFINTITYICREIYCRFTAPKFLIGFYGVDGSCKTLLVNTVKTQTHFTKHTKHCHLLPAWPWKNEVDSGKTMPNPHALPPRDIGTSIAKLGYYFIRYWMSYLWPKQGGTIFLYDRYAYDMLVDPLRCRFAKMETMLNAFLPIIPKQDAAILVDVSAETAQSRKKEVPYSETVRQTNTYKTLAQHLPNTLVIRGDMPIATTSNAVIKFIARICDAKTGGHE